MLTYDMGRRGDMSLYEFLYSSIRADIESGAIRPLQKLPSKRVLAKHLGVSLITVEGAYSQLIAEGYVFAQQRKGYFARDLGGPAPAFGGQEACRDGRDGRPVREGCGGAADRAAGEGEAEEPPVRFDFTGARPVPGLFPYSLWAKTMRQVLSCESEESLLDASRAQGSFELRSAIADYLQGFRGMQVDPDCIVVGAGAQTLYQLIVQLLGREGAYAVEDPGYPRLASIYRANDVEVRSIPLDDCGVSMPHLRESGARVLHCMPSHQFPTGLVMPAARRREVLEWAAERPGRYIVEDDYDCEFRLAGRPIPSLQSADRLGRVIYANTFTRSLGSAFRFGYMVLPPRLAAGFRERLGFYSNTVSALDQLALARFMGNGCYERHVNRLRSHYRKVQAALVEEFRRYPGLSVAGLDAGLHFILEARVPGPQGSTARFEAAVAASARDVGVCVRPLSSYRDGGVAEEGGPARFAVGLTGVSAEDARQAASALAGAIACVADGL